MFIHADNYHARMDDLLPKIEERAKGPKKVQTDSGSTEFPSVSEVIEADRYAAAKAAAAQRLGGIKLTKMIPPGGA